MVIAVSEIHAARITVNRMIAQFLKDKDETVQFESGTDPPGGAQRRKLTGEGLAFFETFCYNRCNTHPERGVYHTPKLKGV